MTWIKNKYVILGIILTSAFIVGVFDSNAQVQVIDNSLTYTCTGAAPNGVFNPRVNLSWISPYPSIGQNSNSLQRGDWFPNDPNAFWNWLWSGSFSVNSYTDTSMRVNETHWYRVKYAPLKPSNTVEVSVRYCDCGGSCSTLTGRSFNGVTNFSSNPVTQVEPGEVVPVSVTFKNTGTTTWTQTEQFRLALLDAPEASAWGVPQRFELPVANVPRGSSVTFVFNVTAPTTPGVHSFSRMRMVNEAVEFFGDVAPGFQIEVIQSNELPQGDLTNISCTEATGWALDPDTSDPIDVHVYSDGPPGSGTFRGSVTADDFNGDVPGVDKNHGFTWPIPEILKDGNDHSIYIYGIDSVPGNPANILNNSPQSINCPPPPEPPTATNIIITEPNYCVSGPAATVTWQYSGADPQSAYQVIIRDGGIVVVDSGKVQSGSNSFFTGLGELAFNTTYSTEVFVWDSDDVRSDPGGPVGFTTPLHAYPQVDFSWDPQTITPGEEIGFLDETTYSAPPSSWFWDFGDGETSGDQNPVHKYADDGDKEVKFTVTDIDGFSCQQIQKLGVNPEPPRWIEVLPR